MKRVWRNRGANTLGWTAYVAALHVFGIRRRVTFLVGGHQILIRTGTPDLNVAASCLNGEFDAALDRVEDPRGLFIDAGSYIGAAAIAFAARFPQAEIVCLEPSPDNFSMTVANTAHLPNVRALNFALDGSRGERMLHERATGEWGHTLIAQPADCLTPSDLAPVATLRVDDVLKQSGRTWIELLKLDIEGGEYAVFSAETGWLASTRVVIAELHDRIVPGCSDVFQRANTGREVWQTPGAEKIISVV
jgi:FkbM family methyltransferase